MTPDPVGLDGASIVSSAIDSLTSQLGTTLPVALGLAATVFGVFFIWKLVRKSAKASN